MKEIGIWHEVTEHAAVFNMEELDAVELHYPDCEAKNLFVWDDKHRSYEDLIQRVIAHNQKALGLHGAKHSGLYSYPSF